MGLANVGLDCQALVLELSSFAVLPCGLTGPGFRRLRGFVSLLVFGVITTVMNVITIAFDELSYYG